MENINPVDFNAIVSAHAASQITALNSVSFPDEDEEEDEEPEYCTIHGMANCRRCAKFAGRDFDLEAKEAR
jgi:hypothetical protein